LSGPVHPVAAGQAACRVDQHRLKRIRMSVRQADLGTAILIEAVDDGDTRAQFGRDAATAARALHHCWHLEGECSVHQTIKWRRTAGRSRSLAGPACWISPRSIT